MWAASICHGWLKWQIGSLAWLQAQPALLMSCWILCWVMARTRLYDMFVCWCLSSLSYLKTCLPLCFAVFAIAMPETMEISDAAKSGDGTTQNVGIKAHMSIEGFCNHIILEFLLGGVWKLAFLFFAFNSSTKLFCVELGFCKRLAPLSSVPSAAKSLILRRPAGCLFACLEGGSRGKENSDQSPWFVVSLSACALHWFNLVGCATFPSLALCRRSSCIGSSSTTQTDTRKTKGKQKADLFESGSPLSIVCFALREGADDLQGLLLAPILQRVLCISWHF